MDAIADYIRYMLEHSTPSRPIWNIEQMHGHQKAKWNYVDGCMLKALMEIYQITKEKSYLDFVDKFIEHYVDDNGTIKGFEVEEYNIDNINEGKVLFGLFQATGKVKYRQAIDQLMQQVKTHPRTKGNSFWHKKIYPNQVWLDGLYMVQPFYMEYETRFNQKANYDDIFRQFRFVYQNLRDPKTKLLYHGWDEDRVQFWADPKTGCSPSFWSRSLGWYVMALVDTIDAIDGAPAGKQELTGYLTEVIEALFQFQDAETGMWYQVTDEVNRPGNYLETSGSAMMAYAILKGVRLGVLPAAWRERGERCFNGISKRCLKVESNQMELEGICLVAGLGGMSGKGDIKKRDGSFEYYISEPVVKNDAKGVAPFLLAYTEMLRIQ